MFGCQSIKSVLMISPATHKTKIMCTKIPVLQNHMHGSPSTSVRVWTLRPGCPLLVSSLPTLGLREKPRRSEAPITESFVVKGSALSICTSEVMETGGSSLLLSLFRHQFHPAARGEWRRGPGRWEVMWKPWSGWTVPSQKSGGNENPSKQNAAACCSLPSSPIKCSSVTWADIQVAC